MLPKNKLRDRRLERLKIYLDDEHPHAQNIIKVYDGAAQAVRQAATQTTPAGQQQQQ